jgi:hypothetical protein
MLVHVIECGANLGQWNIVRAANGVEDMRFHQVDERKRSKIGVWEFN